MMGLLPENGWPEDPDSGAGLVLRGSLLKQRLEAQDKAIGGWVCGCEGIRGPSEGLIVKAITHHALMGLMR
jgi:hypothetical protein